MTDKLTPTMRQIMDIADPKPPAPQGRVVRVRRKLGPGFKNEGDEIGGDAPDSGSDQPEEGESSTPEN